MISKQELKQQIAKAFENNEAPARWDLTDSKLGDEPALLEEEFKDIPDWRKLTPEFLDGAPDGYHSALSFFSHAAFRFYLPAYLLADIDEKLESVNPVYTLCFGLTDKELSKKMFGERTYLDYARYRFAMFTLAEVRAIVDYMNYKIEKDQTCGWGIETPEIKQALNNYWLNRIKELESITKNS